MPGLSQLKQFNADLLNLGDEVKIRSARGEKPVKVAIPKNIPDVDDSEDFKFGMPQLSEEEQNQADALAAERERQAHDFSDITGTSQDSAPASVEEAAAPVMPDVSDLLKPAGDVSLADLDLSDFETPAEPEPEPEPEETPIEDLDLESLLAGAENAVQAQEESEEEEIESLDEAEEQPRYRRPNPHSLHDDPSDVFEDFDVSSLSVDDILASANGKPLKSSAEAEDLANFNPFEDESDSKQADDELEPLDGALESPQDSGDLLDQFEPIEEPAPEADPTQALLSGGSELFDEIPEEPLQDSFETPESDFSPIPDADFDTSLDSDLDAGLDAEPAEDLGEEAAPAETPAVSKEPKRSGLLAKADEFADFDSAPGIDMNEGLPEEFIEQPAEPEEPVAAFDEAEDTIEESPAEPQEEEPLAESQDNVFEDTETPATAETQDDELPDFGAPSEDAPFDIDSLDLGAEPSFDAADNTSAASETEPEAAPAEDALQDMDLGMPETNDELGGTTSDDDDYSLPEGFGEDRSLRYAAEDSDGSEEKSDDAFAESEDASPFAADDEPLEQFDTSDMDGLDLGSSDGGDFGADGFGDDGFGDDDFSIPGFSDTTTASVDVPKPAVERPDFSQATESDDGKKPKNTFTDAEYKKFRRNLADYPLNVRIALEDLVVKNEFTDDAVYEVLEKVLRKVPARQLASHLEKMLDISLEVPRDYERRTAAEYEAYKQSLEYQLKNRIIPGAILSAGAAILIFCIGFLVHNLIVRPVVANNLYKQGYELIQEEQYAASEDKFNKAVEHKRVKKWYYTYADSYRDHKQYDRARNMYKAVLAIYNHEKKAGLDWADMEANSLYNYAEGERILKREVLDYHNIDPDALLQLGDLYMDWADDGNPEKYKDAKDKYDELVERYGETKKLDTYLSRQMRYYIRQDDLRSVLSYKAYFYPNKMKTLGVQDATELSGYLLDKRYGELRPSEEELRPQIENVRDLLEQAVKKDKKNPHPMALYNMGRYFVKTSDSNSARDTFKVTLDAFKNQTRRNRKETYAYIDTYRLLGEEHSKIKEYMKAQEILNDGISLFEGEHSSSNLSPNPNIGKLYSDLGDINYFINGDMQAAFNDYNDSIKYEYDNASIRYRIGYIQYTGKNYKDAFGSFIKGLDSESKDEHLLLALANTLSLKNDNSAASGYYRRLLDVLKTDFDKYGVIVPQVREDQGDLVDVYLKATNNMGVTLSRLASYNGDSSMNGEAIANMQESLRAWDSLTRNQATMVRLEGANLAEQNIKYVTNPHHGYEPAIYTDISKTLFGEEGLLK